VPERQQRVVDRLAACIEETPELVAGFLLGSLARGDADDLSDVDLIVIVQEGAFDAAWAKRHTLQGDDALAAWDDLDPERPELGAHKWITRELVLVELVFATASSGIRLADPFVVIGGDAAVADRVERRPSIAREELREFADMRVETGRANAIETTYEALVDAVRGADAPGTTKPRR
jgi:predicted nucleotidyltransferase